MSDPAPDSDPAAWFWPALAVALVVAAFLVWAGCVRRFYTIPVF